MKYRKKPFAIEAIQWNGNSNKREIDLFVGKELKTELESETAYVAGQGAPLFSLIIETLEGNHKAMPNDWIIKGVKGEFYPCKPDIFDLTYEPVSTSETKMTPREVFIEQFGEPDSDCDMLCINMMNYYKDYILTKS